MHEKEREMYDYERISEENVFVGEGKVLVGHKMV